MFERIGPVTFEPVARVTLPGLTLLFAPLNLLVAAPLSALIGLGTTVTWIALTRPEGRDMRAAPPGVATLLAGVACLVPGATIVFTIPVPSSFVPVFQILTPAALALLLAALFVTLRRLD